MQVGAIYSKKLFSLSVRPCLFLSVGHVLCATFPTILTSPSLPPTIPASSGVDHFSSAHNPPSELQLYLFFSSPPPAICDTNNSLYSSHQQTLPPPSPRDLHKPSNHRHLPSILYLFPPPPLHPTIIQSPRILFTCTFYTDDNNNSRPFPPPVPVPLLPCCVYK